jgi:hypothetical protein
VAVSTVSAARVMAKGRATRTRTQWNRTDLFRASATGDFMGRAQRKDN